MPAVLKEIMRHADIQATMTYYVAQSARLTASELWAVAGKKLRNTQTKNQYTPQESNL
jgi:hypothetical protein